MEANCPYPTDPVEIFLLDPQTGKTEAKSRRVRFTAGALRRAQKDLKQIGAEANAIDLLVVQLWHGLLDRDGLENQDALAERIDARAIPHLNQKLGEAVKASSPEEQENPIAPASQSVN